MGYIRLSMGMNHQCLTFKNAFKVVVGIREGRNLEDLNVKYAVKDKADVPHRVHWNPQQITRHTIFEAESSRVSDLPEKNVYPHAHDRSIDLKVFTNI